MSNWSSKNLSEILKRISEALIQAFPKQKTVIKNKVPSSEITIAKDQLVERKSQETTTESLTQESVKIEKPPTQNAISISKSQSKSPDSIKQNHADSVSKGNRPLDRAKIAEMAGQYGLDVASVLAVAEIESGGRSGFQKTGLLTILFEAHIFYRELKKVGLNTATLMTQYPNLISPSWNRSLYKGGDAENSRLAEALNIHECAWDCASYGMFQIMGFNHQACGFNTVQEFVDHLKTGQEAHIEAFLKFINSDSRKINALKNKDWATFARLYNGLAYAENKYDIKLAEAYKKHSSL